MRKLIEKDKKLRSNIYTNEKKLFILKFISKNCNLFSLIRWKAFCKLKELSNNKSKVAVSNRCIYSANRKRHDKSTKFSRHIYLKLIRFGKIPGMQKSSW